jgi:hypothetical protein
MGRAGIEPGPQDACVIGTSTLVASSAAVSVGRARCKACFAVALTGRYGTRLKPSRFVWGRVSENWAEVVNYLDESFAE